MLKTACAIRATAVIAACIVATAVAATTAQAEDFPGSRQIMIMPYAAGGPGDVITRITAAGMSKAFGAQVMVENIGGAGGTM